MIFRDSDLHMDENLLYRVVFGPLSNGITLQVRNPAEKVEKLFQRSARLPLGQGGNEGNFDWYPIIARELPW